MKEQPNYQQMPIIHQQVAGVDIGSKFHVVAVGENPKTDVREFGISTKALFELAQFLKDRGIQHVAMEATGGYENPLVNILQEAGFDVLVTSGANTKNYRRFKSDVSDAIHIRTLHQLGLLPPIFTTDEFATTIRPLVRMRQSLIEDGADYIRRIQKALRAINVRLDATLTDSTSVSGLAIIKAICEGEEDGAKLAALVDKHCKKTPAELTQLLTGNWNASVRLEVQLCYRLYQTIQTEMGKLDAELDRLFSQRTQGLPKAEATKKKPRNHKNAPKLAVEQYARQMLGVNLHEIPGFGRTAILTLLSEVGESIHRFTSAKAFAKWLGFTPNNKASGGKILSRKTLKNKSNLPTTFRQVANSIGNMKDSNPLVNFFRRVAFKSSRKKAITATARKLAVLIYTMLKKGEAYQPEKMERDKEQVKVMQIRKIKKNLHKFDISIQDLGWNVDFKAA